MTDTSGLVTETKYDSENKDMRGRLRMLTKIYLVLMGWSTRRTPVLHKNH